MQRARSCKYLRSTSASERTIIGLMNASIDPRVSPREISSVDGGLRWGAGGGRSGPGTFCYSPRKLGYEARMFNGEGSKLETTLAKRSWTRA